MSTLGAYHDKCGDIMSTAGGVQYTRDIMSTLGVFSTLGDYYEYTGDTKIHVGVIMSTLGDVQYIGGIP